MLPSFHSDGLGAAILFVWFGGQGTSARGKFCSKIIIYQSPSLVPRFFHNLTLLSTHHTRNQCYRYQNTRLNLFLLFLLHLNSTRNYFELEDETTFIIFSKQARSENDTFCNLFIFDETRGEMKGAKKRHHRMFVGVRFIHPAIVLLCVSTPANKKLDAGTGVGSFVQDLGNFIEFTHVVICD